MKRRRIIGISTLALLLVGAGVLCFMRWGAWFGMPEEQPWQGERHTYTFIGFGQDSVPGFVHTGTGWQDTIESEVLRFVLLGDVHNHVDSAEWAFMYRQHPNLDFYAQLGDFVERSYDYYFQLLYEQQQGTGFDRLPLLATPGNHEYMKGVVLRLPEIWNAHFNNPLNGPSRFLGSTYYVDFPSLRFIAINTNGLQRLSDYTRVQAWVARALQTAGDNFTIVMMHHPVHSSAAGRQNVFVNLFFNHTLQKADLVFAGHDHNYARRLPFVVTNSAKKNYLSKVSAADDRICSGRQLYEYLTIEGDTLRMQTYILPTDSLYDEVTIVRTAAGHHAYVRDSLMPEMINLPVKYQGRHDAKVRRFVNRRAYRLAH